MGASLHTLIEKLFVDHICVSDKADELPLVKVYHFLRGVLGKVDDTNFTIVGCECLVS